MPELKEADISVMGDIEKDTESLLKSITTVKRLTLRVRETVVYPDCIFFSQLENLKVYICSKNWSKLLVHLLKGSPHLRILDLEADKNYKQVSWSKNQSSVPKYFLNSLETFKFKGYNSKDEEDRDFMSLIFKHARCLKSTSILHG
ncbi:unnamed protein product [Arabidopsis arenosa]|uniref:FBD domain-containing protein n=1 Tax=Arabidopsis arenosa TaxID=38785 RepID=A0A8S2AZB4_ARAAE|nr:unnamed protein product [Arabidopsis arenosa]